MKLGRAGEGQGALGRMASGAARANCQGCTKLGSGLTAGGAPSPKQISAERSQREKTERPSRSQPELKLHESRALC